jgi:hypothetical protein
VRKVLRETVGEDRRCENFIRIYPAEGCQLYDKYFRAPRTLNKALYNILYRPEETPSVSKTRTAVLSPQISQGVPDASTAAKSLLYHTGGRRIIDASRKEKMVGRTQSPAKGKKSLTTMAGSPARCLAHEASRAVAMQAHKAKVAREPAAAKAGDGKANPRQRERKVLITGDDVLIEYVIRLSDILTTIREDWLDGRCLDAMCKFVWNPIWKTNVGTEPGKQSENGYPGQSSIQSRVQSRLIEMKMRYAEMQHQIAMAGEGTQEETKEEETEQRKEKLKILRTFASEQLEHILFKSARNSKCGAIESLFISLNPIQGVLTYLQRQFGRTKPSKIAERKRPGLGHDNRVISQQSPLKARKSYAERPPFDLCALPSISETKAEPAPKGDQSGPVTCRSLTSRGSNQGGTFVDKDADKDKDKDQDKYKDKATSSERKGSFNETIAKLKGMLRQETPATSYGNASPQKRNDSKVKEAGQRILGTFRGSSEITAAEVDSKYISATVKKTAL